MLTQLRVSNLTIYLSLSLSIFMCRLLSCKEYSNYLEFGLCDLENISSINGNLIVTAHIFYLIEHVLIMLLKLIAFLCRTNTHVIEIPRGSSTAPFLHGSVGLFVLFQVE